jgi:FKBP-type peptidyl-prolyl cis-trans isomerase
MKKTLLTVLIVTTTTISLFADGTNVLSDDKARASYAIGMMLGHNWKEQGIDVDPDLVLKGLTDEQSGGPTLLTLPEMQTTLRKFQQDLMAKQQKMREEEGAKNKKEGEAFLAANKNKPGVVTLPDGLQYKVLKEGDGETPTPSSIVTVNYTGTLIDGTVFDSSIKRGKPAQFPVTGVIHGWTEALEKMKVGSQWELFIPADLAYGAEGRPGIPPNATLIFDVDLLDVKTPKPAAPAAPLTSDIIKVPSADEMKKGAKIETLTPEQVKEMEAKTNAADGK